ncbi:hypothetical protein NCS52_01304400 [Fusarium sp. LHS14.1]|nr:hypothetical protein NCS52_01304400 [Fusarium sp. LHS14.1]
MAVHAKTTLIPWDPSNEAHFKRMYDQRVACGWRYEEVEEWRNKMLKSQKFLYWIVLADDLEGREELLATHTGRYPDEAEELSDTANTVFSTSREPTNRRFLPIGHIALELLPQQNERFQLPSSTIWIMSLYISWALQSAGLGRSAMAETERLARLPPFNRDIVGLDTVQKHFQLGDNNFNKTHYSSSGSEVRAIEEWYMRQGYEAVERVDHGYSWKDPATGDVLPVPLVYMVKSVQNSTAFEVRVRTPSGKWKDLAVYRPILTEINASTGSQSYYQSSMVYFDFNGTVEIAATWSKERSQDVRVRPDSYGIKAQKSGRSVRFILDRPRDVVLQINGEIFDVLHILANPPPVDEPSEDDPDVIYYGSGFHSVPGKIQVPSGKTLYIAGGSVVSVEAIEFTNVTNAAVRGHGVLTYSRSGNILVTRYKNVVVEGLIGINFMARTFEATNVDIKNWSCPMGRRHRPLQPKYPHRFRLSIYNHRDAWYGDVKNITIQNSSLLADVAHPVNVGSHGNTADPEKACDITMRNVDILDHRENQMLYQGTIALNAGDGNLLEDILIEDVRVENFRLGQILNFRVMFNEKYNTSPGRGIQNVVIRNLNYNGEGSIISLFSGCDAK